MSEMVGECAVCGVRSTVAEIDVPPRAVTLTRHGATIDWESIVGPATLGFCRDDWKHVVELVGSDRTNPLPQCNARYVGYELVSGASEPVSHAGVSQTQYDLEATMWQESQAIIGDADRSDDSQRVVQAQIVCWSLETLVNNH